MGSYIDGVKQGSDGVSIGSDLPLMNGAANAGVSSLASAEDHVHPTDTACATVIQAAVWAALGF